MYEYLFGGANIYIHVGIAFLRAINGLTCLFLSLFIILYSVPQRYGIMGM